MTPKRPTAKEPEAERESESRPPPPLFFCIISNQTREREKRGKMPSKCKTYIIYHTTPKRAKMGQVIKSKHKSKPTQKRTKHTRAGKYTDQATKTKTTDSAKPQTASHKGKGDRVASVVRCLLDAF